MSKKKILFVAMPSIHFIRWVKNIPNDKYEMYWFDILDRGKIQELSHIKQIVGWKKRKIPSFIGEYFLRKKLSPIYNLIYPFLEVTENEALNELIQKLNPDIIHSFEMQSCSYPIINVMDEQKNIPWLYSCWGSDLFYYKNFDFHKKKIRKVLSRVNFLLTDCHRDYTLALQLGFKGEHLGVLPGGGGYDLSILRGFKKDFSSRKIILVKGYEHTFGKALTVVKALQSIPSVLLHFEIVIFGAHNKVFNYVKENNLNYTMYARHELTHKEVLRIMGKSLIYIGNSISDGIPNTMIEAMVMGAFPIQSNPGRVTEELIEDYKNGILINDPENVHELSVLIKYALEHEDMMKSAFTMNDLLSQKKFNLVENQKNIAAVYKRILS